MKVHGSIYKTNTVFNGIWNNQIFLFVIESKTLSPYTHQNQISNRIQHQFYNRSRPVDLRTDPHFLHEGPSDECPDKYPQGSKSDRQPSSGVKGGCTQKGIPRESKECCIDRKGLIRKNYPTITGVIYYQPTFLDFF